MTEEQPRQFKQALSGMICPPKQKWQCEVEDIEIAAPLTIRPYHKILAAKPVLCLPDGMVKGQAVKAQTLADLFVELAETRDLVKINKDLEAWISRRARRWMLAIDIALNQVVEGNPVLPEPPKEKKARSGSKRKREGMPIIGINPIGPTGEIEQPKTVVSAPVQQATTPQPLKVETPKVSESKPPPKAPQKKAANLIDSEGVMRKLGIKKRALNTLMKHPLWPKEPSKTINEEPFWSAQALEPIFEMCKETA